MIVHRVPALCVYLLASACLGPVARWHLGRRLKHGKEDPARWREKTGMSSFARPAGPLVWMHAVGVGEVLALPALVAAMRRQRPGLSVLITSSSRTSALALAPNMPEGALHQFLPLDVGAFRQAFLDHWQPDLAIWAERDIWPGLVDDCARRGIPQLLINGRMNAASFRAKSWSFGLFSGLYRQLRSIGAQDAETVRHFAALGYPADRITLDGSLKAGAEPLADLPARPAWEQALQGRFIWLAASTHPGDEAEVIAAHATLLQHKPEACLIIAPRDPARAGAVSAALHTAGIAARIAGRLPEQSDTPPVSAYVVPRIGELGLWYRLAPVALVGGSIAAVGGHNPYEPARLGAAILHGPHVGNFAAAYDAFHHRAAARLVRNAAELAHALSDPTLSDQIAPAGEVALAGRAGLEKVASRLVAALDAKGGAHATI